MTAHRLILGDCLEKLRELDDASVDAVVTDPPYGINFMGKAWDGKAIEEAASKPHNLGGAVRLTGSPESASRMLIERTGSAYANRAGEAGAYDFSARGNRAFQAWVEAWGAECLRVLKPGGHALVFGGTRTYHRLTCGLEDAGFEIRDCLAWLYGSGFPKSLDVSKAIDAAAGAEREAGAANGTACPDFPHPCNGHPNANGSLGGGVMRHALPSIPATEDAERWQGWGTALKPAFEPIVVARKPLAGTVAANVLAHGTGALNIDASRIEADARPARAQSDDRSYAGTTYGGGRGVAGLADGTTAIGRWPANVVLDEEAARLLDEQTGEREAGSFPSRQNAHPGTGRTMGDGWSGAVAPERDLDGGGASRFFYCAKTSRAERNAGLDGFEEQARTDGRDVPADNPRLRGLSGRRNHHPTVKPVALMRWLVRLVTPPGGHVLDPFLGSGTTGIASTLEGFRFTGIEREPDYLQIAAARIAYWAEHGDEALQVVRRAEAAERERATVAASGQLDMLTLLDGGAA